MNILGLKKSLALITGMGIIGMSISGCYWDDCCSDYTPYKTDNYVEKDAYSQMCYNTMTFDDKYDKNEACYLKEVDKYVEAALACCAPLKDKLECMEFEKYDLESSTPLESLLSHIVYISTPGCNETGCTGIQIPTNAYTHCLLNTHPRTYQCNIQAAQEYATALNNCCNNSSEKNKCISSFIKNGEVCENKCCDNLPDQDTDQLISKWNCLKVLNESNECIETRKDACCRIAPKESSPGHIDRNICEQIYTESNGQCVNTDEKYEIYKKQS